MNKQSEVLKLKEEGLNQYEIARKLKVSQSLVWYYFNEKNKTNKKNYLRNYIKNISKEKKKERYEKNKDYYKKWFKKRYAEDEEFRKKHIQRVLRNQRIMFNSRVSSQKLGATDTALCSPSFKSYGGKNHNHHQSGDVKGEDEDGVTYQISISGEDTDYKTPDNIIKFKRNWLD